MISTGQPRIVGRTVEMAGLTKEGREFPMELSLSTWQVRGEIFFTGIIHDLTQWEQAAEDLRRARDELELRVQERTAELAQINQALQAEIAERKRTEEELRSSEERFRQLAENIRETFWIAEPDNGQITYVSPAYERMWGRPCHSLYQQPESYLDAVYPEDRERVIAGLEKQVREEYDEEYRIVRPDGSIRWIRARAFPIGNERGEVYRLVGIFEDVTERVQAYQMLEQRVKERTRELSTLLEISRHVALTLKLEPTLGFILDQLKAVVHYDGASIFKLEGDTLTGLAHRGVVPPEEVSQLRFPLDDRARGDRITLRQEPAIIADVRSDTPLARIFRKVAGPQFETVYGQCRSWMGVPLTIKDQVTGILDLQHSEPDYYTWSQTELVSAFATQAAVSIENSRLYEQAQALAAMQERQRLARDLHDSVSQTLFSASLTAEVLPRLWERHPDEGRRCLQELHQLTRGALAEMRTLLLELRPTALVETGLADLLGQLAQSITSRARLPVKLTVEQQCSLPPEVQVALYRIAQEALNNVAKHAGASQATVRLRGLASAANGDGRRGVELCISDDGRGFDPDSISFQHLGLAIMRERAETIGATFKLESRVGHGTQVLVVWREPQ